MKTVDSVVVAAKRKSLFFQTPLLLFQGVRGSYSWIALPILFLLLILGLSSFHPSFFTKCLPFLVLGSAGVILRFRVWGFVGSCMLLCGSFLFSLSDLSFDEERVWQGGLLLALANTFFLFLLAIEECENCLHEVEKEREQLTTLARGIEHNLGEVKRRAEEREREFQEEIERLKAEAEARRIERSQILTQCRLIESEIEMLTSRKEEFIAEAREARGACANHLKAFEEQSKTFEEQSRHFKEQKRAFEEESKHFEELYAALQSELMETSEALKRLQQQPQPVLQPQPISQPDLPLPVIDEGPLTQLRAQLEEKSRILSQTRQELFQTRERVLLLERESFLAAFDPEREEAAFLEKEVDRLVKVIEQMGQERAQLEELISRILTQ